MLYNYHTLERGKNERHILIFVLSKSSYLALSTSSQLDVKRFVNLTRSTLTHLFSSGSTMDGTLRESTPPTSPPLENHESDAEDMESEKRLQRIKYLVDQSKLYADFLKSNLQPSSEKPKKEKGLGSLVGDNNLDFPKPKAINADLLPYQLQGVQWIANLYKNGLNGILADEMGLGKTLQVISFLAYLLENGINGPFLIVGPLSTLGGWRDQFARFAPSIKVLVYYGSRDARKKLQNQLPPKNTVVVTSFEMILRSFSTLGKIPWQYLIVDEGHRLKNVNSKLLRQLKKYHSSNRLLLTGTPLQNNLAELWALLNFLLPDVFTDLEIFQQWFENGNNVDPENEESLVTSLHDILRPFLLRRVKSEVGLHLPSKREYVIFSALSSCQRDLYRSILDGRAREFVIEQILHLRPAKRRKSSESEAQTELQVKQAKQELRLKSFANLVMQLRLACDSPFIFWDPYIHKPLDSDIESTSGKLQILGTLTKKLKGHRILIFTQFTKMLDVLEDWAGWHGYNYRRLDGTTSHEDREELLDSFTEDSDIDLFLLSTRSGGQGVNLMAADTVVIFDSDWNPQQDLQAMDRVHRIGQNKPVLVFRLITGDTIEQDLLERADSKLELNNLVIEKGHFNHQQTQEEQLKNMGKQLTRHEHKFTMKEGVQINEDTWRRLLDRSPDSYKHAMEQPRLSDLVFCRSAEI